MVLAVYLVWRCLRKAWNSLSAGRDTSLTTKPLRSQLCTGLRQNLTGQPSRSDLSWTREGIVRLLGPAESHTVCVPAQPPLRWTVHDEPPCRCELCPARPSWDCPRTAAEQPVAGALLCVARRPRHINGLKTQGILGSRSPTAYTPKPNGRTCAGPRKLKRKVPRMVMRE